MHGEGVDHSKFLVLINPNLQCSQAICECDVIEDVVNVRTAKNEDAHSSLKSNDNCCSSAARFC